MYVIYELGSGSVKEVMEKLPDPPSYSAVRTMLRLLEEKGQLRHEQEGPRYVYFPTEPRESVRRSAMHHLVKTFFGGSAEKAIVALLDESDSDLSEATLDHLSDLIDEAKKEGR